MENITKMKIRATPQRVFNSFIDPNEIGNFWFSNSSDFWEVGKEITITYNEYDYVGKIYILELIKDQKIVFEWENKHIVIIDIYADNEQTMIEIEESGFLEEDKNYINDLIDNKEGWVFMLSCLKAYLEHDIKDLRNALIK